ncbi:CHAT domain-containing protein [Streptomyces sp. NPDC102406]|uniref:CHAT domain-containing protein n=1 Tax=Streptomyces sp. NPDC102406 TaxID=3366171 RepID=UPI0037FC1DDA
MADSGSRDEILRRVGLFLSERDPDTLLEPAAERAATALRGRTDNPYEGITRMDIQDGYALGLFYWLRSGLQPPAAAARDREECTVYFRALMATAPSCVPEEIRDEILADPTEHKGLRVLEELSLATRAEEVYERSRADRDLTLLDESIALATRLLTLDPKSARMPHYYAALSHRCRDRHEWTGAPENLEAAIAWARAAVEVAEPGSATAADYWALLDSLFAGQLERTGDPVILDDLVETRRSRVAAWRGSQVVAAEIRLLLAKALLRRFDERHDAADRREAVRQLPPGAAGDLHEKPQTLVDRFVLLQACFSPDDSLVDKSDLIEAGRAALGGLPAEDGRVQDLQVNTAFVTLHRYKQDGDSMDLLSALDLARAAVEALSDEDERQVPALRVLADALMERHEQETRTAHALGIGVPRPTDLDHALRHLRRCVDLTPPGHPQQHLALRGLGDALVGGADTDDRPELLSEAIDAYGSAFAAATGPSERAESLRKRAIAFHHRYRASGQEADLDEAVELCRRAVATALSGSPEETVARLGLAEKLAERLERHPEREDDRRWAMEIYRAISADTGEGPVARMTAARSWGRVMHRAQRYDEALEGYDAMLALLPEVAPVELAEGDRMRRAEEWSRTPTMAATCAVAAGRPERALELVEGVRLLTAPGAGTAIGDVDALRQRRPDLAAQVDAAQRGLAESEHGPDVACLPLGITVVRKGSQERRLGREAAARTWQRTVAQVREAPGFEWFLAPARFDRLRRAADAGPAAVPLASPDRCDVLLLTDEGIRSLPLQVTQDEVLEHVNRYREVLHALRPGSTLRRRQEAEEGLARMLTWLWHGTVRPTLDALGLLAPRRHDDPHHRPHLWWSPSGLFSHFPLHAAAEGAGHGAMDHVVSSYAPSLRLLAGHNADIDRHKARERSPRLLAVGVSDPSGLPNQPLKHVPVEMATVSRAFPEHERTLLTEEAATVSAVRAALPHHHWLHFACHAGQVPSHPASSRLYLYDGALDVSGIRHLDLRGSRLAVLSACETATSGITLMDEGLYLGGAMHVAGCPDVVATLWRVGDRSAAQVVEALYAHLLRSGEPDSRHVATALHLAALELRARAPDLYSSWASFVHIGVGR